MMMSNVNSEGSPAAGYPDSGQQATHLPPELEEGNREYKWKLVHPSPERLTHLTTQLNWRLNESGRGEAVYLLGVRDDGYPIGLSDFDFAESIQTLRAMAKGVKASVVRCKVTKGREGKIAEVLLRREESRYVSPLKVVR